MPARMRMPPRRSKTWDQAKASIKIKLQILRIDMIIAQIIEKSKHVLGSPP